MIQLFGPFLAAVLWGGSSALSQSLVERLGFQPHDTVLIINCDDLGMCHAENVATFECLTEGVATSATVMMPCPWVMEVVQWKQQHPEANLGVHLTLTAEWKRYRWAGVLGRALVPSLHDEEGYLFHDNEPLWESADPDEVYRECRAQVERAIELGLEPTHIDNHMGSLQTHPTLWQIYCRLGEEFDLPLRLAAPELYALMGAAGQRDVYTQKGLLGPDVLLHGLAIPVPEPDNIAEVPAYYNEILRRLQPGKVTELYLHTALDGPELEAIAGSHARRQADHDWLCAPETRQLIDELGIKLISYRPLRELQRKARQG
ncbi:MAG: polysaccharide deacetylase family protein [Candidatus Zipacnadales bacterium]